MTRKKSVNTARKNPRYRYVYKQHSLKWPKSLYVEWWRYEKLVDSNIGTFEEWFDPEKYAEPRQEDDVKILSNKNNKLVLEVDLTHNFRRVMFGLISVMANYMDRTEKRSYAKVQPSKSEKNFTLQTSKERRWVYVLKQQGVKNLEIAKRLGFITKEVYDWKILSKGTNKHTTDRDIKNELSKLEAIIAKQSKDKEEETPAELYLNAERTIQRHNAACKKTLEQIEKGTFP